MFSSNIPKFVNLLILKCMYYFFIVFVFLVFITANELMFCWRSFFKPPNNIKLFAKTTHTDLSVAFSNKKQSRYIIGSLDYFLMRRNK